MARSIVASALVIATFLPPPIWAHHSSARYDLDSRATLEGVIREVAWAHPHVYLLLEVEDSAGNAQIWEIEAHPPNVLTTGKGWTRDSVTAGDRVAVVVSPNRNPDRHEVRGRRVIKDDGTVLLIYERSSSPEPEQLRAARATDISGAWAGTLDQIRSFVIGEDDSGSGNWRLTEAGEAARNSYSRANYLDYVCVSGGPPLSTVGSPDRLMIAILDDSVLISTSSLGLEERVVQMNRDSLEGLPFVSGGQSIGHWEGDVLVVESGRFLYHPSGNAQGLPSSSRKHVVERFELAPSGTMLKYSLVLEDPVYIAEPVTFSVEWQYRPDQNPDEFTSCDEQNSRRGID